MSVKVDYYLEQRYSLALSTKWALGYLYPSDQYEKIPTIESTKRWAVRETLKTHELARRDLPCGVTSIH